MIGADDIVEADETFQVMLDQLAVHLAGLEDRVTIATETATATILNDDSATLSITGPGALDEGAEFVFTVTLSNGVQDGLTVAYTTEEGTATLVDNDFQDNLAQQVDLVFIAAKARGLSALAAVANRIADGHLVHALLLESVANGRQFRRLDNRDDQSHVGDSLSMQTVGAVCPSVMMDLMQFAPCDSWMQSRIDFGRRSSLRKSFAL